MLCPEKNAYLQLVCPIEPRVINKCVRQALRRKPESVQESTPDGIEIPSAQKLESTQPSLFDPDLDVTQARLGFGRLGLQIINKELNSDNYLVKLQAIHTIFDQVQVADNVFFLINLNIVYRLIDLMLDNDPLVREKIALILTHLATFYQGRKQIISRPVIVDHLINMFIQDRKEVRYAASFCLETLTRDRCACEMIIKNDKIIETLLKMIKHDYMEIVLYHMNSLKNLSDWDPVKPLKANAFQVMKQLLICHQNRVVQAAMDCLTQLCKHSVGKKLADKYDINYVLLRFLQSPDIEVIVSTVGLMQYTTITEQAKWRIKQFTDDLVKRLVTFSKSHTIPVLQLRAMHVLINLCDCSNIRDRVKANWEDTIVRKVKISSHEHWQGTSEVTTFALETGYNYETMCIEDVETIKSDYGDSVQADNVHSYINQIRTMKSNLIKAMNDTT